MKSVSGKTVCVTGAGGFIGSWIVKLLLEKGYTVRGTVRCLDDAKISHLIELPGAKERLNLYKADILHYERLFDVINGCDGVFHTACPVSNDPEAVVEAAVNGTKNVILAAANAKVGRVVFTSSFGALHMDPNRNPEAVIDESYWSDLDFCKNSKNWYCYGKTLAEKAAWELAEEKSVDLVTVIPVVVIGPYLQPSLNISNSHIQQYVNGSTKTYPNAMQAYVHVKDVASAHILVYETESASGRYICAEAVLHRRELVEILSMLFPGYPTPTKSLDDKRARGKPFKLSNTRIKELGLVCTPIKQCLYETVKSLQEKGHLAVLPQQEVNIESTIIHSSTTVQPAA